MGVIKSAIKDTILTSMWVFSTPFLGVLTSIIASNIGIEPKSIPSLFITIHLATLRLLIFSCISSRLGGAIFNATTTVSLYAAGYKPDVSLVSMAVRFPAQAAGGAVGVIAILKSMPRYYKYMLKSPILYVDLHTGAIVGIFNFLYCLALLLVMIKGPNNFLLKLWMLAWARAIIGLVVLSGEKRSIPMNPANAYGWAYENNLHNTWEFFHVYWICPFIGATLAAWVFGFLFKASIKHKQV